MNQNTDNRAILEAARASTFKNDEFERRKFWMGLNLGQIVALVLGGIIFFVQLLTRYYWDFGLFCVLMTLTSVSFLYEGIAIKQVWKIVVGGLCGVLAVFSLVCWVGTVIA